MSRILIASLAIAIFVVNSGCHYFYDQIGEAKRIPSPVSDDFPYDVEGEIYRVWCGNELQTKSAIHTTYIILQGVNNPDMGVEIEQQAIDYLYALLDEKTIRAQVFATDDRKRAIAQVYCGDRHLNLEMIKNGWGQYDGSDFNGAEKFLRAESVARKANLGIWKK